MSRSAAEMFRSAWSKLCLDPAMQCVTLMRLLRSASLAAFDHDIFTVAQATSYSAIIALFPALIVAAAVIGMLPDTLPIRFQLAAFFDRILPSNVTPLLDAYFSTSHANPQTTRVLLGSVVVSLTGASSVMSTLMDGFRRAHDLPLPPGSFWPRRLRSLALVPLSIIPMTFATLLVVFGQFLTRWLVSAVTPSLQAPVHVMALVLRWVVALCGSVAVIGMIYHLGTDLDTHLRIHLEPWIREPWTIFRKEWSWRSSLPGATVATLLWFVSTLCFGLYVTRFANYSRVYGSLGAAIALLFWLYIIALSVLMGSEFNAQLTVERKGPGRGRGDEEPVWKRLPGWAKRRTGRMTD
ncbi:MAG: YihY/virulence factor BrkB family protein [Acidobacteriota bacterium]